MIIRHIYADLMQDLIAKHKKAHLSFDPISQDADTIVEQYQAGKITSIQAYFNLRALESASNTDPLNGYDRMQHVTETQMLAIFDQNNPLQYIWLLASSVNSPIEDDFENIRSACLKRVPGDKVIHVSDPDLENAVNEIISSEDAKLKSELRLLLFNFPIRGIIPATYLSKRAITYDDPVDLLLVLRLMMNGYGLKFSVSDIDHTISMRLDHPLESEMDIMTFIDILKSRRIPTVMRSALIEKLIRFLIYYKHPMQSKVMGILHSENLLPKSDLNIAFKLGQQKSVVDLVNFITGHIISEIGPAELSTSLYSARKIIEFFIAFVGTSDRKNVPHLEIDIFDDKADGFGVGLSNEDYEKYLAAGDKFIFDLNIIRDFEIHFFENQIAPSILALIEKLKTAPKLEQRSGLVNLIDTLAHYSQGNLRDNPLIDTLYAAVCKGLYHLSQDCTLDELLDMQKSMTSAREFHLLLEAEQRDFQVFSIGSVIADYAIEHDDEKLLSKQLKHYIDHQNIIDHIALGTFTFPASQSLLLEKATALRATNCIKSISKALFNADIELPTDYLTLEHESAPSIIKRKRYEPSSSLELLITELACYHDGIHDGVPVAYFRRFVDANLTQLIDEIPSLERHSYEKLCFLITAEVDLLLSGLESDDIHPFLQALINFGHNHGLETLFRHALSNKALYDQIQKAPQEDVEQMRALAERSFRYTPPYNYDITNVLEYWFGRAMGLDFIFTLSGSYHSIIDEETLLISEAIWNAPIFNPSSLSNKDLVDLMNQAVPGMWTYQKQRSGLIKLAIEPRYLKLEALGIEKAFDIVARINHAIMSHCIPKYYFEVGLNAHRHPFKRIKETNSVKRCFKEASGLVTTTHKERRVLNSESQLPLFASLFFRTKRVFRIENNERKQMHEVALNYQSNLPANLEDRLITTIHQSTPDDLPSRMLGLVSVRATNARQFIASQNTKALKSLLDEAFEFPSLYNHIVYGRVDIDENSKSILLAHAVLMKAQACVDVITQHLNLPKINLNNVLSQSTMPTPKPQRELSRIERLRLQLETSLSKHTDFKLDMRLSQLKADQKGLYKLIFVSNRHNIDIAKKVIAILRLIPNVQGLPQPNYIQASHRRGGTVSIDIQIEARRISTWMNIFTFESFDARMSAISEEVEEISNTSFDSSAHQFTEMDKAIIKSRMQHLSLAHSYACLHESATEIRYSVDYNDSKALCKSPSDDQIKRIRSHLCHFNVRLTQGLRQFEITFLAEPHEAKLNVLNDQDWDEVKQWLVKLGASSKQKQIPQAKPIIEAAKSNVTDLDRDEIDYADLVKSMLAQLIPQAYYPALLTYFQFPDEIRLFKDKFIPLAVKPGVQNVRVGDYGFPIAQCLQFLAKQGLIFYLNSPCLQLSFEKNCLAILSQEQETLHAQFQDWIAQYKIEYQHYPRATIFKQKAKVITQLDKIDELIHDNRAELKENGFFDLLEELKYCDLKIEHAINEESKREKTFLQCHYKAYGYYLTMVIQRLFDVVGEHSNDALSALRHTVRHMRYDSHDLISLRSNTRAILKVINEKITKPELAAFKQTLERYQNANQQQTISKKEALSLIRSEFAFIEEVKALPVKDSEKLCIKASLCHSANLIHQLMKAHRLYGQVSKHIKDEIQKISQEIGHSAISPHLTMQ